MTRLPRRLLLWGGAAAVAAGGFAFMAQNSVANSSAGEGTGTVTGYNVTAISYTVDNHFYASTDTFSGKTGPFYAAYTGVSFTLTAQTEGSAAGGQPTNVDVYPVSTDGNHYWGHDNGCTVTSWTAGTDSPLTAGTGSVSCNLAPSVPAAELGSIAVEANQ